MNLHNHFRFIFHIKHIYKDPLIKSSSDAVKRQWLTICFRSIKSIRGTNFLKTTRFGSLLFNLISYSLLIFWWFHLQGARFFFLFIGFVPFCFSIFVVFFPQLCLICLLIRNLVWFYASDLIDEQINESEPLIRSSGGRASEALMSSRKIFCLREFKSSRGTGLRW